MNNQIWLIFPLIDQSHLNLNKNRQVYDTCPTLEVGHFLLMNLLENEHGGYVM